MPGKIAVIFDMDGVIIHSNPLITKAWRKFFESQNILLTDEQLKHCVFGRTSGDTLRMVIDKPMDANTIRAYQQTVETEVQALYRSEGTLIPGFKAFVESLKASNIAVAIATAAPPLNVEAVLQMSDTASYFAIITNADDVHQSKPHPEVYLTTAKKLGIDPQSCIVFEDSFSGIQSAKSAGMKVIGVTTTHSAEEFAGITDAVINDFTKASVEMVKWLMN